MSSAIVATVDAGTLAAGAMRNLEALFRAMCQLEGAVLEEGGPVSRHLAWPTNPMFKGAWASRLGEASEDTIIAETIDWFRSRGAPYFFWWTDDDARPTDLGQHLEAHDLLSTEGAQSALAKGIVMNAAGAPVMVLDLETADRGILGQVPRGFHIEEVATDAQLEDFKRVFVETYEIPDWAGQGWVDATRAFGVGHSPWRMFVGYLGDDPVATNLLFCGGGVASPYAVATLPRAQRQGIGGAITLEPLLVAHEAGYRHAALFSTEPGFPVYRRLGFTDTGRRINRYLWRAQ